MDYNYLDATTSAAQIGSGLAILSLGITIFSSLIGIIMLICMIKIYKKAGKPGWAVIVPIYNAMVLAEIAGLSNVWGLLMLIPIVNIVAIIKIYLGIAKKFGKSEGYAICLLLFGIIFIPLLAFSDSKYDDGMTNVSSNNENLMGPNTNMSSTNSVSDFNIPVAPIVNATPNNAMEVNEQVQPQPVEAPNAFNEQVQPQPVEAPNAFNEPVQPQPVEAPNAFNEPVQTQPVEAPNAFNEPVQTQPVEVLNPFNEPVQTQPVETPSAFTEPVQPQPIETPSAFNEPVQPQPIETPNTFTEPVQPQPVEVLNPFNDQAQPQPVEAPNTFTEPVQPSTEATSSEKICKSCGKEMPKIVSICPNCGTEN